MNRLFNRYFSFEGRLARLAYFLRSLWLGIAAALIFLTSVPLFIVGGFLWWVGLLDAVACFCLFAVSAASIIVRRLHDIGLSSYHAIWVVPAQVIPSVVPRIAWKSPADGLLPFIFELPLVLIGLWLLFWPGDKKANRFGEVPE
jgi:uncharacterized membrane protein YhaH (DUF805 family)